MAPSNNRFEFIDYSVAASGRARLKPEVRRRARVLVMKDFLRKTRSLDTVRSAPRTNKPLSHHKTRFRVKQSQEARPSVSPASSRLNNTISDGDTTESIPQTPAASVRAFIRIENPTARTRALLDYYLHAYWTNSIAVNPDGAWTTLTLADPAMIHAKLSLVALHRADRGQDGGTPEYLYHRGQAMLNIKRRLEQGDSSRDDGVIGTVALLASLDDHSQLSSETKDTHLQAVAALVQERGGIDSPQISDALRLVLGWVDLLHATLGEQRPSLGTPSMALTATPEDIRAAGAKDFKHSRRRGHAYGGTVGRLYDIKSHVSLLMDLKAIIIRPKRNRELRRLFSSSLWKLEYDLANIEDLAEQSDPWSERDTIRAFRDAAIVCSYANLREQNSVFIFGMLMQRIQRRLSSMLSNLQLDQQYLNSGEATLLLWVLSMGWKAALMARSDGRWFSIRGVAVAIRYGLSEKLFGTDATTTFDGDGDGDGDAEDPSFTLGLSASEVMQLQDEMQRWAGQGTLAVRGEQGNYGSAPSSESGAH
ncbi:uncharacterized protein HMPREF1541_09341 [Cyphellophora europaea CBS 101466]|uniref:Transcription factor domain-containing protein n=1 Tax=Cyphellophora europaea (strain CBS 101466) TaxID=1220924 RepID=W2SC66_CYPE1|nr:uncharacterized protein HMPREF1541_09341 [Cyphellophora europaea CBS 101466]ETN45509.1 hypothetical protein HMPREF1541_09341 [Cyphellophora europaea CBS 101466]